MIVAVVGKGRNCPVEVSDVAYIVGKRIAEAGHLVVTGGLGGCMLGAAHGAASAGGTVIGLTPAGRDADVDPSFPGIVIPTGMSEPARNVLIGSCCQAMVACDGSHGTLQELAVALDREIPVVQVRTQRWSSLGLRALDVTEVGEWLTSIDRVGKS